MCAVVLGVVLLGGVALLFEGSFWGEDFMKALQASSYLPALRRAYPDLYHQ